MIMRDMEGKGITMVIDVGVMIIGALGIYVLAWLFVSVALSLGIWGLTWNLKRLRQRDEIQGGEQRVLAAQSVGSPHPEAQIR